MGLLLVLLLLLSKRDGAQAASFPAAAARATTPTPGPTAFPAPNTAAETIPTGFHEAAPAAAPAKRSGVAPGTPEPGWKPYLPVPSLVVQRAFAILRSGDRRVKEADPTGKFSSVLYRREESSGGKISVTAWRPAVVANA